MNAGVFVLRGVAPYDPRSPQDLAKARNMV
jgi:hypothetical protein